MPGTPNPMLPNGSGGPPPNGFFSGPNQTRNLLLVAGAVVLLVAIVIASVVVFADGEPDSPAADPSGTATMTATTSSRPARFDATLIDGLEDTPSLYDFGREVGSARLPEQGLAFKVGLINCAVHLPYYPGSTVSYYKDVEVACVDMNNYVRGTGNPTSGYGWTGLTIDQAPSKYAISDSIEGEAVGPYGAGAGRLLEQGKRITFNTAKKNTPERLVTCGSLQSNALVCVNRGTGHGFWWLGDDIQTW
ncbi:hypothetical protein MTP03_16330 [Tsukamurella sp. PLM1]|nr:hypothetical protein MTP03_16330 [Tsukamurella sp. PLM1]